MDRKMERKNKNNINNDRCRNTDDSQQPNDKRKTSPRDKIMKEGAKVVNHSDIEHTVEVSDASGCSCDGLTKDVKARKFTFSDLVAATQNFKDEYFLGEGGFGKVYKGHLRDTDELSCGVDAFIQLSYYS